MSKLNFAIQIGSCKRFYLKWLNSPAASGGAARLDFNVEKCYENMEKGQVE